MARGLPVKKMLVPLESTEWPPGSPKMPPVAVFTKFLKIGPITFSILAWSFLMMVLMNCQKMDLMESL